MLDALRGAVAFSLLLCCFYLPGSLAGEPAQPLPEVLPPVIVEGKRIPPATALPSPATPVPAPPVNEQGNGVSLTNKDVRYSTAETVRDTLAGVPGVAAPGFGIRHLPFASVRGHVNINFGDPNAPLVLDGIAWADWRAPNATLIDVDTVRIERGTQRSAGGRSAVAGAIVVESKAPTETYTGSARAEGGNYGQQIYEAAVSGPIVKEKLLFRVAAQKALRDGYQRNKLNGEHDDDRDTLSLRGELQYKPLKELDIRLQGLASISRDGAPTLDFQDNDVFEVSLDSRGRSEVNRHKGALKIRYDAPLFTVFSNTARQYFTVDHDRADYDFSARTFSELANEATSVQWSQEFRLESARDASIRWRAGTYFEDFRRFDDAFLVLLDTAFIQGTVGLPFTAPVRDRRQADKYSVTGAVFGDFTFDLGGGFSVEPGLRVEHRYNRLRRTSALIAQVEGQRIPTGPDYNDRRDTTVALPSLKLIYDSKKEWSVYALGSSGYRSGGFSHLATEAAVSPFENEYMWATEVGLDGTWLNGKLITSAALYHNWVDDYQVRRESTITNIRIDNAERAWMRGAELELTGLPVKGLELTGRLSLLRAQYDRFEDRVTGERFDDQRIPHAATYQFLLRGRYEHECGFFTQVDYSGRGRTRLRDERAVYQRPYAELAARVGYEHKHVSVFLYGNNLTDQRSTSLLFALASDGNYIESPNAPRTFGISVTFKY